MNTDNKKLLSKEGYNLMGVDFEVYNELGYGLLHSTFRQWKDELEWKRYIITAN